MSTLPDSRFTLTPDAVHVWHANLESQSVAQRLEPILSPDEIQRANRFRFAEHRRRFIIARGCLRRLLEQYLQTDARDFVIAYSPEGKPSLDVRHRTDLKFNVSHSGEIAAFAFTLQRNIGIDVELIRRDVDVEEIPRRFFSCAEQKWMSSLEGEAKFQGFFNCWTRKEAYVKAVGTGLSLPLRDFDVSLMPGQAAKLLATRPDATIADRWHMAALDFGGEYAAAVIVDGSLNELEKREFFPF
ncbi:MAG TPA: 4'-phosphopantetheinyl transferase superfamily protein [Terriglobales bacterium]|nr:4'-phosphopantetheinyl transferase superfamily protein [Terriglobales bacterium]